MGSDAASRFLPDMVKGDLDSLREDVKLYYTSQVLHPYALQLPISSDFLPECTNNPRRRPRFYRSHEMCASAGRERAYHWTGGKITNLRLHSYQIKSCPKQFEIVILGGLSGRLDQTV